jgi:hypothetical protein
MFMDGLAQVASQQTAQEEKVLRVKEALEAFADADLTTKDLAYGIEIQEEGPVQTQLFADAFHVFHGGVLAQHDDGRIAGDKVNEQEDEDGHPQQSGNQRNQPTDDVSGHWGHSFLPPPSAQGVLLQPGINPPPVAG